MNFLKLNVVDALPSVTSADAGARVLYKNKEWVVLPNGEWCPSVGYKEGLFILSQSGSNSPTIISSIGGDFDTEFTRVDVGVFTANVGTENNGSRCSINGSFSTSSFVESNGDEQVIILKLDSTQVSDGNIQFSSLDSNFSNQDGLLNNTLVTIRLYP
jgi:hypothetical protein